MRLQDGICPVYESFDRTRTGIQALGSPMPPLNTDVAGEVSSWYYKAPLAEKKNRLSLLSRLKTVSSVARHSSRPTSILSVAVTEPSHRGSSEWRDAFTPLPFERSERAAKSILSRGGRMLRRHGGKFSLSSIMLDEGSVHGHLEVSETCQRPQQRTQNFKRTGKDLKRTISHPFGFHHVTHTQPQQFERLDRGSQNELITEFIAIRAAQRPRSTLQGIQADDLCNSGHVKQPGANVERHPRTVNTLCAPVGPLNFAASTRSSSVSPAFPKSVRSSPSIENFSRPTPWSPKSPTSPPPRTSSRNALHSPPLPAELARKSTEGMNGHPTEDFNGHAHLALNSDVTVDDSQLRLAHAITTVDDSARPLKTSPLPTPSANEISKSTARASRKEHHSVTAEICSSTNLPLRHAYSFPIARVVSQHGHHYLSDHGQHTTETRPESLRPERTGEWEDVVDYCYENAAEADCNFDWSQKTVYVDADHESLIAQAPDAQIVEKWTSPGGEEPQSSSNHASRTCPGAFRQPRIPARFHFHSRHNSKKSPEELEDCLSPFGRHQASSDFRGYQHRPQASSKSIQKLRIVSDELCADRETTSDKEPCEYAELEMPGEDYATSERCHSGGSSTYRVVRPLLHKYSSDGSMLSSTTSTIRTYRSSNSVGSVPDLVYSLNNNRESVMAEKALPTDAVAANNERPQIPQHLTSAARRQVESQAPTADRSQGRSRPQAKDTARKSSASAPTALVKLSEFTYEPVDKHKKANATKSKTGPAPRKRSASALTPGQCLTTRASYSLFPPQHHIPPLT